MVESESEGTKRELEGCCSVISFRGRFWKNRDCLIAENHDPSTCPRTQTQEPLIMESESFWAFRPDMIIVHNRRVAHKCEFIYIDAFEAIDINHQSDFDYAENIAKFIHLSYVA